MLLLCALRDMRRRRLAKGVRPAGLAAKGHLNSVTRLWKIARSLRFVTSDDIQPKAGCRLALVDCPVPNSKARMILDALIDGGCPEEAISTPRPMARKERHTLRLRAFAMLWKMKPARRRLNSDDLSLCLASFLHTEMLEGSDATVIHIGDRSERRIAMTAGAALAGRPSVYWQTAYHDTTFPPLGYTHAAVMNKTGEDRALGYNIEPLRQALKKPRAVSAPSSSQRIGIAMNAFAGPEVAELCRSVLSAFPSATLELRTHPRIASPNLGDLPKEANIRPRGEALSAFCDACDIVLCGNSAVQIEMLLLGVLVIHIPGLDDHGFDLYRYVAEGVTYGTTDLDRHSVDAAIQFYAAAEWPDRLLQHVSPPSDACRPISALWTTE